MQNPLLEFDSLPAFDRIEAGHARPALETMVAENRARLAGLTSQPRPTFASLVVPVEELGYRLSRVWSPIGHLNAVANSPAMREAYNACVPLLTGYSSELGQNAALHAAYARVLEREGQDLEPAQRKLLENALRDFRLSGVDLPEREKERYRDVVLRLAHLATKFSENVLDAAKAYERPVLDEAELRGLPPTAIERAAADAREAKRPGWLFKLDQPTYMSVMTSADSRGLRRDIYEAWVTRASELGPSAGRFDNHPLIEEILPLRHELARILGFANYADYALATRMAKSTQQVLSFLEDLGERCRPAALREFAELEEFAGLRLEAWDLAYYSERLQESRFKVSQQALRPYFPLPKVLDGLFTVTQRLYGISVRERPGVGVWHPDVRYYDLIDAAGDLVAGFYLDPYSRTEKRSGAWMDECIAAKALPAGKTIPVAQLVCNFTSPVGATPSLLTHDEVTTLFHEFGHGLHHMLTRVAYPSIAGINGVSWDAVELPSQFMENFVWRPEVLPLISAHVVTGEPLPADVLQRLLGTRTFNAALDTLRQIELATFDFELHAHFDPVAGARVRETLARVRQRVAVTPAAAFNRMPASFSHIFAGGYAAGYYSYKWAEVLAADAFEAFEEAGIFDRATAGRFADSILTRGGSLDAMDAFVRFRGRPPDVRPLFEAHRHRRVRRLLAAAAALSVSAGAGAAVAYVTDELVLNVYALENGQGQRLATLHSGATVETLGTAGDYTQIRLGDGITGWVRSAYLTPHIPATVRVKQLEDELDRSRATTPELAEAAARSELDRLQHDLREKQSELEAALAAPARASTGSSPAAPRSIGLTHAAWALLAAAALGFWLGYALLARRIRRKFGGLKVY